MNSRPWPALPSEAYPIDQTLPNPNSEEALRRFAADVNSLIRSYNLLLRMVQDDDSGSIQSQVDSLIASLASLTNTVNQIAGNQQIDEGEIDVLQGSVEVLQSSVLTLQNDLINESNELDSFKLEVAAAGYLTSAALDVWPGSTNLSLAGSLMVDTLSFSGNVTPSIYMVNLLIIAQEGGVCALSAINNATQLALQIVDGAGTTRDRLLIYGGESPSVVFSPYCGTIDLFADNMPLRFGASLESTIFHDGTDLVITSSGYVSVTSAFMSCVNLEAYGTIQPGTNYLSADGNPGATGTTRGLEFENGLCIGGEIEAIDEPTADSVLYARQNTGAAQGWIAVPVLEAPDTNLVYGRHHDGATHEWVVAVEEADSDNKTYGRKNAAWVEITGLADEPTDDGLPYARQRDDGEPSGYWTRTVPEADSDDKTYGRYNETWVEITGLAGEPPDDGNPYARQRDEGESSGYWVATIDDAPADDTLYGRYNNAWTEINTEGIVDAPNDGEMYGRQSEDWALAAPEVAASGTAVFGRRNNAGTKSWVELVTTIAEPDDDDLPYARLRSLGQTAGSWVQAVEEADDDTKCYVRQGQEWVEFAGSESVHTLGTITAGTWNGDPIDADYLDPDVIVDLTTAYNERRQWDGGSTNLNVNTARANLGISNVENTALSTWIGSTNLTRLGIVSQGTWQGTAIANAYIVSAAIWNAKEPGITAGTTGQYWRGDKSWQTLDKAAIGLGNVENTALSTWQGSNNINRVGTITQGTWNVPGSNVTGNNIYGISGMQAPQIDAVSYFLCAHLPGITNANVGGLQFTGGILTGGSLNAGITEPSNDGLLYARKYQQWVATVPEVANDGVLYARKYGLWQATIADAPNNSNYYARSGGAWSRIEIIPTFGGGDKLLSTTGGGTAMEWRSIQGTSANRIIVSFVAGTVRIDTPQDLHTSANVQFSSVRAAFKSSDNSAGATTTQGTVQFKDGIYIAGNFASLPTISGANRLLGANASANGYEWKDLAGATNQITVTHSVAGISLGLATNTTMTSGGTLTIPGSSIITCSVSVCEYIQPRTSGGTVQFCNLGVQGSAWMTVASTGVTIVSGGSLTIAGNSSISAYIGKLDYIQPRTSGDPITFSNLGGGTAWLTVQNGLVSPQKLKLPQWT